MAKHYHFIGIGGIGMSGIAQLLAACGQKVTGSDLKASPLIDELRDAGVKVFLGHNSQNIAGADLVVYSSAVKEDNPEIIAARGKNIPLLKRAQALAKLMHDKNVVTVTGSHGKTTTTSLVSYLLLEAGFNPTVAIGGILRNIDTNACLGNGRFFVAEADESDGSFLYYRPKYSIITNIDHEHLDYYRDFSREINAFEAFLDLTAADGCAFYCFDDDNLREVLRNYKKRSVSFGLKAGSDILAQNIVFKGLSSGFDCYAKGKFLGRFALNLGGAHNVSNALAVIGLARELGIDTEVIRRVLTDYRGTRRRLEIKFKSDAYVVIDDYAHHPTEIRATLAAVRNLPFKRLVAVFQPHRFSRTRLLWEEFARSFDSVDALFITDIYPAGEKPEEGITGNLLCQKIKENLTGRPVVFLPKDDLVRQLLRFILPGDLLITLGAGDIVKCCDELVEELKR